MAVNEMLALLLISSVVCAHPHFPGHPRFYDEGRESGQPTVNVFKIYAPRLFYMPGYKPRLGRGESNFVEKSKQMITEPTERILDGIIRAEMFPDSLFEDDMEMMQYDDDYVPEPSNVVSRKLPIYTSFRGPPMVAGLEPPMNLDEYPLMRNNRRDFMDDSPQFFPDYFDMHGENCNHHHHFQSAKNNPMLGPYSDYAAFQVFDPLFLNDIPPQSGPMGNIPKPAFAPVTQPLFQSNPVGPLRSFFNKFVSDPMKRNDQIEAQLLTTVTYGAPEIVKSNEVTSGAAEPAEADTTDSDGEIEVIITEELEPIAEEEQGEKRKGANQVEEIERNFIKTILPDNTFVTTEVSGDKKVAEESEDTSESKDGDVPMKEVEVNIVKTILPDDSYLVSEAGGENEKFQDEVISMIQNSDVTATEGSKGSVFISRYLEAPSSP